MVADPRLDQRRYGITPSAGRWKIVDTATGLPVDKGSFGTEYSANFMLRERLISGDLPPCRLL